MSTEPFWEMRREEMKQERFWNGVFFAGIAMAILALGLMLAANVAVDLYLKVKNNGDRKVHAVEVVK